MKYQRNLFGTLATALLLLVAGLAIAAEEAKPDGTVTIDETQFAFLLGGTVGGGELTYHGKTHQFKLGGLTAGANVGVSKMSAAGEVYHLKKLEDFPGTYTKLDMSATVGGGVGVLHLKNEHGVVMKLKSRSEGIQLNVGSATGVKVTME